MQRVIDGQAYRGEYIPDQWEVRTWKANGILERSARQCVAWFEDGAMPGGLDPWDPVKDADALEERAQRNLKRNAQRAKQQCRRIIISEAFDEMLTLTYRENQCDEATAKIHFREWARRMARALPGFRYCAAFQPQDRGAVHIHCATHKLPKHVDYKGVRIKAWELGTKVWRSVVGLDSQGLTNGLCFVGGSKAKNGHKRRRNMSLAKMAAYVSRYVMRDYERMAAGSKRFSRSVGTVIAEVHRMVLKCSFAELVAVTFELMPGTQLISHRVGYFKDSLWLCTEGPA